MARRRIDQVQAKHEIVTRCRAGLTLALACRMAGVHVATACRWKARDPAFAEKLRIAVHEAWLDRYLATPVPQRSVPWHRDCPLCRAKVVVRKALGHIPFWRCGRWPHCSWASWRPRHPRNCRRCGGPRFWSHSLRSVSCDHCRNANFRSLSTGENRTQPPPTDGETA